MPLNIMGNYRIMIVNHLFQFNGCENHHGNRPLEMYLPTQRKMHPKCSWHNPTGWDPGLKTENKREMNTAFTSFCFLTANKIGLAPQALNPTTFSLRWTQSLCISKIKLFFKKAWFQYSSDITPKWTTDPHTSSCCNIICWGKCFFP